VSDVYPLQRLSEIVQSIDYGLTASATKENTGNKFLRITDIQEGTVDWSDVPFCDAPEKKLRSAYLSDGDIVFARTGATTGKSFLVQEPPPGSVFASYLIRVRPYKFVDPHFLAQFFQSRSYWNQIQLKTQGAAQGGVNATSLGNLEIPLPPLDEQRRIAAILDKANALRRKRKRIIELVRSIPQSLFLEMFGDPHANPGRWNRTSPLSDVADIGSGITKGRKEPSTALRTVPYLAVANVQDRALDLTNVKTIEASEEEIDRLRLKSGDLVLTEGGDPDKLGRGTVWRDELPEVIHQNHIFRVRVDTNELDPLYLNFLVGSGYGKKYFLRSAKQTTGIASINKSQLSSFPVLLPPLEMQRKFSFEVERLAASQQNADRAGETMLELFTSLQHRAFSGQL